MKADVRGRSLGRGAWGMPKREQRLDGVWGGPVQVGRGPAHSLVALTSPVQAPRPVWLSTHPPSVRPPPHQCCPCAGSSLAISQERGRKDRQGESPKRSRGNHTGAGGARRTLAAAGAPCWLQVLLPPMRTLQQTAGPSPHDAAAGHLESQIPRPGAENLERGGLLPGQKRSSSSSF